ncbi:hypothetical protein CMV_003420 [Castanea mollissima]|uniref:Apple domain-containing protein n=1 Tax=Castanea mollissima TaxID=60419 RepID=A0A8J4RS43_9ROSI|nr:hypothetical protein CMV_003420 [Castanea mollissima]
MTLTSWKSQVDPAPGNYTFRQDQDRGNQYKIENRAIPYWKSGLSGELFNSDNNLIFTAISNLLSNSTSGTGRSTYKIKNKTLTSTTPGRLDYYGMRLVMDLDGHIKLYKLDNDTAPASWSLTHMEPRDNCSVFNACGSFGSCNIEKSPMCNCLDGFQPKALNHWNSGFYSEGCTRKYSICGKGDNFLMLNITGVGTDGGNGIYKQSAHECKVECLSDCRCQAYSFQSAEMSRTKANTATCWIWSEDVNNIQEESIDGGSDARELYVRVGLSDIDDHTKSEGSSYKKKQFDPIILMIIATLMVIACCYLYYFTRKKEAKGQESVNRERNQANAAFCLYDNFGLARIFGGKQTEATTTRVVGTYGYMSPEYALDGFFSIKSDAFSFGVVVLEVISGKRNTGFHQSEHGLSLLGYAWKLWREGKALDLMDQTMHETCNADEFFSVAEVTSILTMVLVGTIKAHFMSVILILFLIVADM